MRPTAVLLFVSILASSGHTQIAGWKRVQLTHDLSVSLPETARSVDTGTTPTPGQHVWAYVDGTVSYVVSSVAISPQDMAKSTPDQILAATVAGIASSADHATLKQQRDVLFSGWPGIEALIVGGDRIAQLFRGYVVDRTLYQVGETYVASNGRPIDTDEFMNSLAIGPAPAPGPLKRPGPVFAPFRPTAGGFEIGMPGKPETAQAPLGKPGSGVVLHRFTSTYGNRVYVVGYADLPVTTVTGSPKEFIKNDVIESLKAKVAGSTTTNRDGQEVDTVTFLLGDQGAGRLDLVNSGSRYFSILMIYPSGHVGSKDIDTFFDSFKVLPKSG